MKDKPIFNNDSIVRADDGTTSVSKPHISAIPNQVSCDTLLELCRLAEPDLIAISKLVSDHPYWRGLVLHLANSASLGLMQPVTRVNHAVAMIGARRIGRAVEYVLRDYHDDNLDQPVSAQQIA